MASTTALYTGLSGLNAHARMIDVVGNNIANVNRTGFKSSRIVFSDVLNRNISIGSPPADATGGTNPTQIGLGVAVAGTQRNMQGGTIGATGVPQDLAVDGNGLFVVDRAGTQFFTRDGAFRLDENFNLVTPSGDRLQGYPIDNQFRIQEGALASLSVPIGSLTVAQATTTTRLSGNLNAGGEVGEAGAAFRLGASLAQGFGLIAGATVPPGAGFAIEPTSLLTEIVDLNAALPDTPLLAEGQRIELRGAERGTAGLPTSAMVIEAGTTVQDLLDFFTVALGMQPGTTNPDGSTPGASIDPVTGEITITGLSGSVNDLEIEPGDLRVVNADGTLAIPALGSLSKTATAGGESVRTSMIVFDSLGTQIEVQVAMTLVGKDNDGTVWRYDLGSPENTGPGSALGSGTVRFDTTGRLVTTDPIPVLINRDGTGAGTPLAVDLFLQGGSASVTALTDQESRLAASFRDGAPIGTLEDFTVAPDGVIYGAFSNTLIRPLGQVALATFTNPEGLVSEGSNLFRVGANSGPPAITEPGQLATGRVVGGALERSNVDISEEFINLVLAQTGYTASTRIIRTTDDLMQQLLSLAG